MAPQTNWASMRWKIATTSPTFTPPCCINWGSIRAGSKCQVKNGLKSTLASRSKKSSPEGEHVRSKDRRLAIAEFSVIVALAQGYDMLLKHAIIGRTATACYK